MGPSSGRMSPRTRRAMSSWTCALRAVLAMTPNARPVEMRVQAPGCLRRNVATISSAPQIRKLTVGLSTIVAYIVSNPALNLGLRRSCAARRIAAAERADVIVHEPIRTALRQHGRYPYWPITARPPFRWPRGEGLAVYVALNLEAYAFGEGMSDELVPASPAPDVLNYSWLDYGNRIGAWRILELCGSLGLPLTVLVNSRLYDLAPELITAFRRSGAEIAAHGRTNAER